MNDYSEDIYLIKNVYETDDYGNQVSVPVKRLAQATKKNIMMSEFYQAAQAGIRPEVEFIIHTFEYDGEQTVEYNGTRYSVIRLFERSYDELEIYLQRKVGDVVG